MKKKPDYDLKVYLLWLMEKAVTTGLSLLIVLAILRLLGLI